jgi:hypothetical protein
MATDAPGTERPTGFSTAQNLSSDHHFALLNALVLQMDWLELGHGTHGIGSSPKKFKQNPAPSNVTKGNDFADFLKFGEPGVYRTFPTSC